MSPCCEDQRRPGAPHAGAVGGGVLAWPDPHRGQLGRGAGRDAALIASTRPNRSPSSCHSWRNRSISSWERPTKFHHEDVLLEGRAAEEHQPTRLVGVVAQRQRVQARPDEAESRPRHRHALEADAVGVGEHPVLEAGVDAHGEVGARVEGDLGAQERGERPHRRGLAEQRAEEDAGRGAGDVDRRGTWCWKARGSSRAASGRATHSCTPCSSRVPGVETSSARCRARRS